MDSYGVKYRLEFSDVDENPRKLEIEQKGYTGEVLKLIGQQNPVTIKYESSDKPFEKVILGSKCSINLYVTDDCEYDSFYKYPEKTYKIKIYEGVKKGQDFELKSLNLYRHDATDFSLWNEDVGSFSYNSLEFEALDNVSNNFKTRRTKSQEYIDFVINNGYDSSTTGGIIDNESCCYGDLEDTPAPNYKLYWQGWLVADKFKEKLTPKPYPIKLGGIDELALIKKDYPHIFGAENTALNSIPTYTILNLLPRLIIDTSKNRLYRRIYIEQREFGNGSGNYSTASGRLSTRVGQYPLFNNSFKLNNNKKNLEQLLSYINFRMAQCNGEVYMFHVGTDNGVYTNVPSMVNAIDGSLGMLQENQPYVREQFKGIEAGRKKYFTGFTFNSAASTYPQSQSYYGSNTIQKVKTNLLPIKNNLRVEYIPPIAQMIGKLDYFHLNRRRQNTSQNPTLEFTGGYVASVGSVGEWDIVSSGNKCWRSSNYSPNNPESSGDYTALTFNSINFPHRTAYFQKPETEFKFDYYVQADLSSGTIPECRVYYRIELDGRLNSSQTAGYLEYWFDQDDRRWEKSYRHNYITLEEESDYNTWNTFTLNIDRFDTYSYFSAGVQGVGVKLIISNPYFVSGVSQYEFLYVDNYFGKVVTNLKNNAELIINRNSSAGASDVKEAKLIPWAATGYISEEKDVAPQQQYGYNYYEGFIMDTLMERMSLYSMFVHRYEGTFKQNNNSTLAICDNIYLAFENDEDDSISYLDGLEYNVKMNEYKVIAHKGTLQENTENDVTTTLKLN